jgi:hypothetical protein
MRLISSIATAMVVAMFPLAAHADEPASEPAPAPPSAPAVVAAPAGDTNAVRLGPILEGYADEAHSRRVFVGVAGLVLGAAEITAGLYMNDNDAKGPGLFVIAFGAGTVLGSTLAFFVEAPMEHLASSYRDGLAQGRPMAEVVERTEREWAASAHRERTFRTVLGITGLAAGALTVGVGVTVALISTPSDPSVREQQGVATALIGLGHLTALGGVLSLVQRGTVESAYDSYMHATGRGALRDRLTFGAAPLAGGGGMASFGVSF